MVGRPEGPLPQQSSAGEEAANRIDLGHLHRLLIGEGRQDGGETLGQHAFARARRTDHQEIVSPCGSHLQPTFGGLLAFDLCKIWQRA